MHRRMFALIVAVFCVILIGCVGASAIIGLPRNNRLVVAGQPGNQVSLPSWGTEDLRDIAVRMAGESSDANPTSIHYARTTNQQAGAILFHGDSSSKDSCYAVVLQGTSSTRRLSSQQEQHPLQEPRSVSSCALPTER